jgi:hypothetical protein
MHLNAVIFLPNVLPSSVAMQVVDAVLFVVHHFPRMLADCLSTVPQDDSSSDTNVKGQCSPVKQQRLSAHIRTAKKLIAKYISCQPESDHAMTWHARREMMRQKREQWASVEPSAVEDSPFHTNCPQLSNVRLSLMQHRELLAPFEHAAKHALACELLLHMLQVFPLLLLQLH